jgi:hypothetical protein
MKVVALTSVAILLGAGSALAAEEPSGRPSAVLDDAQCESVWNAESDGSALKADRAPSIVNFPLADKDNDGKISNEEFKRACNLGWVSAAAAGNEAGDSMNQQPKSSQP